MDRELSEMQSKEHDTVSATDAAIALGCSLQHIYNTARVKKFPGAERVDGQWRIPRSAVLAYLEKRKQRARLILAA
jgi:excisionase family DNA binding protein